MSKKPPLIRSINWFAAMFQLLLIGAIALVILRVFQVRDAPLAFLLAAVCHYIYCHLMRNWLTKEHRGAVKLVRKSIFAEAANRFEANYRAMVARPWIDRFRWLLLGSASTMSYREMALCNAAFCYSQVGDGERAINLYEQALREFPGSGLAATSLRMLNSVRCQNAPDIREPNKPVDATARSSIVESTSTAPTHHL